MEPRSNEEEPTSATQSEDEPHLHGAQAAPESDEPPRATVLTEVSIPHQPPVGKPKGIQTSLRPHKGQDGFKSQCQLTPLCRQFLLRSSVPACQMVFPLEWLLA